MKVICCDLPYADNIEIHALSDLHLGDVHCEYKAITEKLAYILNTPNAYCLLDGDLMDAAIASSVGDTYSASIQPMEQLKQCVKLFKPWRGTGIQASFFDYACDLPERQGKAHVGETVRRHKWHREQTDRANTAEPSTRTSRGY